MKHLLREKSGATAIEYGLIAALIAIGMVPVLTGHAGLSTNIERVFWCANHVIGGKDPQKFHSCRTLFGQEDLAAQGG